MTSNKTNIPLRVPVTVALLKDLITAYRVSARTGETQRIFTEYIHLRK